MNALSSRGRQIRERRGAVVAAQEVAEAAAVESRLDQGEG